MNWIVYSPFCLVLILLFIKYLFFKKRQKVSLYNDTYYINNKMVLCILMLSTSFVFLENSLTFVRVGSFFILLIYSILTKKINVSIKSPIVSSYVIFYCWIMITFIYSEGIYEGIMMLVKLAFPFLFLFLGYNAICKKEDYFIMLKKVSIAIVVCIITIGIQPIGNITRLILGRYFFDENGSYYCAVLSSIPLCLFFLTHKKKYLLLALCCFLPSITYIRRAALIATSISFCVCLFSKYKKKAIFPFVLLAASIVVVTFSVPEIKERVFGGDKGKVNITLSDLGNTKNISESINTSGREKMWSIVLDKFYKGNEIAGCGLGTMKSYLTSDKNPHRNVFQILHNDFLHLLCESGIVSLILWFFFTITIFNSVIQSFIKKEDLWVKLSGVIALSSFCSILFIMSFANVISAPFLFIIPFILIGFHIKLKYLYHSSKNI